MWIMLYVKLCVGTHFLNIQIKIFNSFSQSVKII